MTYAKIEKTEIYKRYLQKREDHVANVLPNFLIVTIQFNTDSTNTTQLGEVRLAYIVTVFDACGNARWLARVVILTK
tara:strand:- start:231 stop:461 length:231 start_codon:yes stop_codon:yes gene_type:complete